MLTGKTLDIFLIAQKFHETHRRILLPFSVSIRRLNRMSRLTQN